MKRTNLTFTTPKSKAVIKAIRKRLRESAATVFDLAEAIGKSRFTVKCYLAHLAAIEAVICVEPAHIRPQRGSAPAVWALNVVDAPKVAIAVSDDEVDLFKRKVIVRQQWEPNHSRMVMDCYLFGLPAAWQGAAA